MTHRIAALIVTLLAICIWPARVASGAMQLPQVDFGQDVEESEFPEFISADELRRLIKEGAKDILILDNAPNLVWEEAHIPGAVSFPWVRQITEVVKFPRNKTLILYCPCTGDEDSIDMAKKLRELGYFKIKVLEGGWFKWEKLGYEIVSASDEQRK
jgi:rhodanese-related sulfurtransferase